MFKEDIDGLLLNDVFLSEHFVRSEMLKLELLPLRLYLRLILAEQCGEKLQPVDYYTFLDCSLDEFKCALVSLSLRNLIEMGHDQLSFKTIDLKKQQIHNLFPLQEAKPKNSLLEQQLSEYQLFLQSVNETFFHGKMSSTWYNALLLVKEDYQFDNDVIYYLVQDVAARNKLRTPTYLRQVAKSWHERGVISFAQLQQDQEAYSKIQQMVQFVQQEMRRTLTQNEVDCVKMWVQVFAFSEEVIAEAFSKSIYYNRPTLDLFHRILTEWYQAKLHTIVEVRAYEEAKRNNKKAGRENVRSRSKEKKTNFQQREEHDNTSQLHQLVLDLEGGVRG